MKKKNSGDRRNLGYGRGRLWGRTTDSDGGGKDTF